MQQNDNPEKLDNMSDWKNFTSAEKNANQDFIGAFESSQLPISIKLRNFSLHTRRQDIARFLARYEIFKLIVNNHGSVVECGVYAGGGLMSWLHFSSILEPYNHTRRIIGFDTFAGFPNIDEKDKNPRTSERSSYLNEGGFATHSAIKNEIEALVEIHDRNRPIGHVPKVELVPGDACQTIPKHIESNSHLLISLLYLDFDIYEPTKVALEYLYPRVVRGGIVAFDELNDPRFPGETIALLETLGLGEGKLRRFPYDPYISYFVKE